MRVFVIQTEMSRIPRLIDYLRYRTLLLKYISLPLTFNKLKRPIDRSVPRTNKTSLFDKDNDPPR